MKKQLFALFILSIFSLQVFAQQIAPDNIITGGKWTNAEKTAQIEFYKKDNKYFGKLIMIKDPTAKDIKNPKKELRTRLLNGVTIITDMVFEDGEFCDGKIYSPQKGIVADCTIKWINKNKIGITGRKMFISQTQEWTR